MNNHGWQMPFLRNEDCPGVRINRTCPGILFSLLEKRGLAVMLGSEQSVPLRARSLRRPARAAQEI